MSSASLSAEQRSPYRAPGGEVAQSSGAKPVPRSTSGRTRIAARALDRLVSAVAADALGVDARSVTVSLSDDAGRLVLAITAPIRVVPLARVAAGVGVLVRDGGPLVERAALAQDRIRARTEELTGYEIDRVGIRLNDVIIQRERRVK